MSRGGTRFLGVVWTFMALTQAARVLAVVLSGDPWDWGDTLALSALVASLAGVGWLLYVRHRDSSFWDEEEARRADWERRGRAL